MNSTLESRVANVLDIEHKKEIAVLVQVERADVQSKARRKRKNGASRQETPPPKTLQCVDVSPTVPLPSRNASAMTFSRSRTRRKCVP